MTVDDPDALRMAHQAMEHVPDGAHVLMGSLAVEPRYLMRALTEHARRLDSIDLWGGMLLSGYSFLSSDAIRYTTWFPPTTRAASIPAGRIQYLPLSWAQVAAELRGRAPATVVMVQVAPADGEGFHSLSLSAGHVGAVIDDVSVVLAEVNGQLPRTPGRRIHHSRLAAAIPVDYPVPEFPTAQPTAADEAIAELVAELLDDNVTLQVGVGSTPDACLRHVARAGLTGLRIHSGATSAVIDLERAGSLARSTLETPAIRVGEIFGDRALYEFVDRNPTVELLDARQTHYASALQHVDRLHCVNSAISVDLFGQVNCEYVNGIHRGAVGGLADFAHAATWPGNRSIIALRSTTSGDRQSRIVRALDASTVSLSRDLTEFVVTEYGVADLRGKTTRERRRAIAGVAHPRFRASLEE
jgi:4-hydroxybutyrate CoA-transferase